MLGNWSDKKVATSVNLFQRDVLEKIGVLFGLRTLSAHIGHLHEYSIFTDPQNTRCANSEFAAHRIITMFVSEHCTT